MSSFEWPVWKPWTYMGWLLHSSIVTWDFLLTHNVCTARWIIILWASQIIHPFIYTCIIIHRWQSQVENEATREELMKETKLKFMSRRPGCPVAGYISTRTCTH